MNIPRMFTAITQLKLHKSESDKTIELIESDIVDIKSKNEKYDSDIIKLKTDVEKIKEEKK